MHSISQFSNTLHCILSYLTLSLFLSLSSCCQNVSNRIESNPKWMSFENEHHSFLTTWHILLRSYFMCKLKCKDWTEYVTTSAQYSRQTYASEALRLPKPWTAKQNATSEVDRNFEQEQRFISKDVLQQHNINKFVLKLCCFSSDKRCRRGWKCMHK